MYTFRLIFVSLLMAAFNLTSYGVSRAVTIDIPERELIDVMNADIEYILANKPGPRIRDGALASAALLRMGINGPVKEWLDAVTFNESAEWGAQGEYVFAVRNYIDCSGDKAYLQTVYPKVIKVLEVTRGLRRENMGRSYYNDLFALRGFKDGAYLADLMGRKKDADWMQKEADGLRKSICDSIDKSGFDPAEAAAAIVESGEMRSIPKGLLKNTYDKYFSEVSKKMVPGQEGALAPDDLYCANAYFMMDQRDRGLAILRYFPKNSTTPSSAYPGYINAVRTMFVYEDDGKLILGQGLAPEWFDQGIEVKEMPTLYGKICYVIKKEGDVIRYFIYGTAKPPKGVKFVLPKELSGCKIEEMKAKQ